VALDQEEEKAYQLESSLGSIQAILQDVERIMQRSAVKRGITIEQRVDVMRKLEDASAHVGRLPIRTS
jgi:hypothetical protein